MFILHVFLVASASASIVSKDLLELIASKTFDANPSAILPLMFTCPNVKQTLKSLSYGPYSVLGDMERPLVQKQICEHKLAIETSQIRFMHVAEYVYNCLDIETKGAPNLQHLIIKKQSIMYLDGYFRQYTRIWGKFPRLKQLDLISKESRTILQEAAETGNLTVVGTVLSQGALVDKQDSHGNSALHMAITSDSLPLVELLLENGADPNLKNSQLNTPLMVASLLGSEEIVDTLVKNGAKTNQYNRDGKSELYFAIRSLNISEYLIDKGSAVNPPVGYPTPLMVAITEGNEEVVSFLIEMGALVDAFDVYGMTALMYAAVSDQQAMINILLERNADPDRTNRKGRNAMEIALERGFLDCASSLQRVTRKKSRINL